MRINLTAVIAVALVIIALNMTVQSFRSTSSAPTVTAVAQSQKDERIVSTILPVVMRASTDYDALGSGTTGFVVQDGASLSFVRCDQGSRLGSMPTPKYLIRTVRGSDESVQPIFVDGALLKLN